MGTESAYFICNATGKQNVKAIQQQLDVLNGVTSVSINPTGSRVAVNFDNTNADRDQIKAVFQSLGFDAAPDDGCNLMV